MQPPPTQARTKARAPKTAEPTPRKRSKRAIETERRFLAAANQVFWTNGYAGATIMEIIEASGQSVGSFYYQFTDKTDLLNRAMRQVIDDFETIIPNLEFSRQANGDLYTLFYRLAGEGRALVGANRGVYRALSELSQNSVARYGPLRGITPTVSREVNKVIGEYADQLSTPPTTDTVTSAVQLLATCVVQAELEQTPLFPRDLHAFSQVISRGACGVLAYRGQTLETAKQEQRIP